MVKLVDHLKKDIKLGRLDKTDVIIVSSHLVVGLMIWCAHQYRLLDGKYLRDFSNAYIFLGPLVLVGLFFRRLRKIRFWFIWVLISILQLWIYSVVKDHPDFDFLNGNAFDSLVALFPTLLVYQVLRLIYYSVMGREMIVSLRQNRWSMYEEEEGRNMNWMDVLFSMVLGATSVFSEFIVIG